MAICSSLLVGHFSSVAVVSGLCLTLGLNGLIVQAPPCTRICGTYCRQRHPESTRGQSGVQSGRMAGSQLPETALQYANQQLRKQGLQPGSILGQTFNGDNPMPLALHRAVSDFRTDEMFRFQRNNDGQEVVITSDYEGISVFFPLDSQGEKAMHTMMPLGCNKSRAGVQPSQLLLVQDYVWPEDRTCPGMLHFVIRPAADEMLCSDFEEAVKAFLPDPCMSALEAASDAPAEYGWDWSTDEPCHTNSKSKPAQVTLHALRQYATSPRTPPDRQLTAYLTFWAIYSHGYKLGDFKCSAAVLRTVAAALDAYRKPSDQEAEMYADYDKRTLAMWLPRYSPVYCGDPSDLDGFFLPSEEEVSSDEEV